MIIANERAIKFFHHLLFKKMTKTILSRDMKLICGDINLIYVIIIFFNMKTTVEFNMMYILVFSQYYKIYVWH